MKSKLIPWLSASCLIIVLTPPAFGAKGDKGGKPSGGCNSINPAVTTTILDPHAGVLSGDGSLTYDMGVINLCSGSTDLTSHGREKGRTMTITLPAPEANPSWDEAYPAWSTAGVDFFNVSNILCKDRVCGSTFTTSMAWRLAHPDGDYHLRFMPPTTDADDLSADDENINLPMETSPVTVMHFTGNCETALPGDRIFYDHWIVEATNPSPDGVLQLGTLHKFPRRGRDPKLHMGQYSAPFKLLFEAQSCF